MTGACWCEWAWLGGPTVTPGVVVEHAGGRVTAVTAGVDRPPAGVERLAGVALPGLVDAHSHAFHRALRGRTHASTGAFDTWRAEMWALAGRLDPDTCHALARAAFAEQILAGITTVGEFHYVHHAPDGRPYSVPGAMGDALVAAAGEAGVRLTLLDTAYLRGGFGADLSPAQRRFADADVDAWASRADTRADSDHLRVGAAIHSVRAVSPEDAAVVAKWADARGVPLHAHVSEQRSEHTGCREHHGLTPTRLLAEAGALGPRFTAVHATHADADDRALLGAATASCCLCPTTERDLGDGIGPGRALAAAGAVLAVGSDSHAVVDLFEEARAVELDERLATGRRGLHAPADLLAAATAGGARSLGWPDAGRLAVGALADLVVVGLDGPRLAGTEAAHAVPSVVHVATAGDVRHVMAGGRWVVRDGAHATLDVAAELARAIARVWA